MLKNFIGAVLALGMLYGLMEAWPILAGPSLSIDSPAQNAAFPSGIVEVKGIAARAAALKLNGSTLLREEDGTFSSTLTFPRGSSILTVSATDRFGRTVTARRTIFVPADATIGSPIPEGVGIN